MAEADQPQDRGDQHHEAGGQPRTTGRGPPDGREPRGRPPGRARAVGLRGVRGLRLLGGGIVCPFGERSPGASRSSPRGSPRDRRLRGPRAAQRSAAVRHPGVEGGWPCVRGWVRWAVGARWRAAGQPRRRLGPPARRRSPRADVVAAEDTRRLARLARDLDVTVAGRVVSYFEGNEERRTPELVEALRGGATVALITDGGMPSVSDPGYRLVRAALDAGVAGDLRARAERGDHRAGAVRPALRPVLLRGLPAPAGERAPVPAARAGRRDRARWSSSRRRTGSPPRWPTWPAAFGRGPAGRGLPRADQDVRGGPPRPLGELAASAAAGGRAARSRWSSAARHRRRPSRPADEDLRGGGRRAGGRRGTPRARRHRRGGGGPYGICASARSTHWCTARRWPPGSRS